MITAASSDPIVVELDELQFTTNEGPCLDAVAEGGSTYAADLADDSRWPQFGPAAARAGIRSALAFRLSDRPISALNLYARMPAAFGATDRAKGVIFATLAGIALDAAGERADDESRVANLHEALRTRELIGQAQGILIERERITSEHWGISRQVRASVWSSSRRSIWSIRHTRFRRPLDAGLAIPASSS